MHRMDRSRLRGVPAVTLGLVMLASLGAPAAAQEPQQGGTLVVAADSEPANLNPAMVASNGVFYVSSKVVEPLAGNLTPGAPKTLCEILDSNGSRCSAMGARVQWPFRRLRHASDPAIFRLIPLRG